MRKTGYNTFIERIDNYLDMAATTGGFGSIFEEPLYGYSYGPVSCGKPHGNLRFSLFFVDPFDPVLDEHGDPNDFCKEEIEGFEKSEEHAPSEEVKNMQVVPLQYKSGGCGEPERVPQYDDALLNNIYQDRRDFFKRLLKNDIRQIKRYRDNSILYKVTFDLPFDKIANHVTVDKTLRLGGVEKTKNIYSREEGYNSVENLFKMMMRIRSNIDEMTSIMYGIQSHPEIYKRPVATGEPVPGINPNYTKECANFDNMCRTKDGYNIENAQYLLGKLREAYDKMEAVLFQARYFDIHAEPQEPEFVKCSHNACNRMTRRGQKYCDQCVQLNTHECNFCGK